MFCRDKIRGKKMESPRSQVENGPRYQKRQLRGRGSSYAVWPSPGLMASPELLLPKGSRMSNCTQSRYSAYILTRQLKETQYEVWLKTIFTFHKCISTCITKRALLCWKAPDEWCAVSSKIFGIPRSIMSPENLWITYNSALIIAHLGLKCDFLAYAFTSYF